jgi:hypothetical protein
LAAIAVPEAKGFRIRTTPEWWELPLDPATRDSQITALVAERRPDADPEQQRLIAVILKETATAAHNLGAGLCAEYAAVDEAGRLIGANLMVTEAPVALPPEDLEEHATAMAGRGFPSPEDSPPAECSVVNLAEAGPAIRVRSDPLSPGSDPQSTELDSLRLQFFVPTPGTETTAVVTFSSPVVTGHEPEDQLVEFFDAMAETFFFVDAEGEPIPPPDSAERNPGQPSAE